MEPQENEQERNKDIIEINANCGLLSPYYK